MTDGIALAGGGLLLYLGAEWFVSGASALALSLRIPRILVGLTVVAYGTSAPEVVVGVAAAGAGHGEVALGNIVGSNIANIGLILGTAALIRPAQVDPDIRRRELPVLVLGTALLPLLFADGALSRFEALLLLAGAFGYTGWMVRAARRAAAVAAATHDVEVALEAADAAGAPRAARGIARASATAAVGLAVLLVGGQLFVGAAVALAQALGLSERLVGLTIVAVGTSLPELVTSVIAARRGHADLAVGNAVGSNIFNVFLGLGTAGLAGQVLAPLRAVALDLTALAVMTALGVVLLRRERTISRREGGLALGLYLAFMALTIGRG